jgi:hypothetical protein
MYFHSSYQFVKATTLFLLFFIAGKNTFAQEKFSSKDTMQMEAIVYMGDTMPLRTYDSVAFRCKYDERTMTAKAKWTRLRNAVYVTFPYAKRAGIIMNDINRQLVTINNKKSKKAYIRSREKELRKDFTDPLTNLSVYQGKVLMKLINRETGNNCYDIIKEYKGGFVARVYQTVAFFFSSNLKQPYDKFGDDAELELIVQEVERMYGFRS